MPLHCACGAAAKHNYDSPVSAVQQLLPASKQIAKKIFQRVVEIYPTYRFYSSVLSHVVKTFSIWNVEMFEVYLWVCVLEKDRSAIDHDLFSVCVMLLPIIKVQWQLIRLLLHLLRQEIRFRLTFKQANTVMPYFQVLWHMFSPDVFGQLNL